MVFFTVLMYVYFISMLWYRKKTILDVQTINYDITAHQPEGTKTVFPFGFLNGFLLVINIF